MLASQTRRLALGLAQQPWSLASNAGMAPALTMRLHGALAGTRVNEAGTFAGFATQGGTPGDHNKGDPALKPEEMHRGMKRQIAGDDYLLMHPVYTKEYVERVKPSHRPPENLSDRVALRTIQLLRKGFDLATGYGADMDEKKWLRRFIFLETIAGVPGMMAGMVRHLRSLRLMRRDHGWIHTLLEEAENERMHLMTFLQLRQPGMIFRGTVLMAQGIFANFYFLAYIVSPKTCHAMIGYLEEEATATYTRAIHDLDSGRLPQWSNMPAPPIAVKYWKLEEGAKMRDVLLAVRADEACHMHVNHTFSKMRPDEPNPFDKGAHEVS